MRSRAKNSARAQAHRRCGESYTERVRFDLGLSGLTRHLLEERRTKRSKPRMSPELIDANPKLKWNAAELISGIRKSWPGEPAFSNSRGPEAKHRNVNIKGMKQAMK